MSKPIRKTLFVGVLILILFGLTVSVSLASGGNQHRVRYGETLYSIGRYYGVSARAIAQANQLYNPDYIYAGQVLYIPEYGHRDGYKRHDRYDGYHQDRDYSYDNSRHHRVRYGETLSTIAYRYGVSPWALAKANNIHNLNRIYAGQWLYIPGGYY